MERQFVYKSASTMGVSLIVAGLALAGIAGFFLFGGYSIGLRFGLYLSPENSAGLFTFGLVLAPIIFLIGLIIAVRGSGPRQIIVGPTRVVLPKSQTSNKVIALDPRAITRVKVRSGNQGGATLSYTGGKVSVLTQYFENRQMFDEFVNMVEAARAGALPPAGY